MRKILFITVLFFTLGSVAVKADNDKLITKEKLPAAAQKFVTNHFAALKISYVKEERDLFERNYEVVFTDGSKVEFLRNGDWKEIDCRYSEVPSVVVPDQIKKYVSENYPDAKILQIDRDRHDYEVKLSNRLELTFDRNYNIIDIDD
ncbi:MAG: PepSY-like domain-containing protein [Bacteroidaceae bacterium]|nr:PepSY-like domain-containing protein [Bacteroidaceae bacterium]